MASAMILAFARIRVGSLVCMWNACIVPLRACDLLLANPATDSRSEPLYAVL